QDKQFNRQIARQRIAIEHINRRLKIFKILALPYRNRRRRVGLRCNLIAAIYNFEVSLPTSNTSSPQS
ncbi:MAG: transposase family protein, partial [Pseudanabaena sp.]